MKSNILRPAILLLALLSFTSFASSEKSLSAQLIKCGQITLADARLVCFDGLLEQKPKTTMPSSVMKTKPAPQQDVNDFAKEHLKKAAEEQGLESITSTVSKLKKLVRGQWVLSLSNGQQWQQKDTTKFKVKLGDTVRLKKGAMGVVYLYKEGSHRNIRVKRLK